MPELCGSAACMVASAGQHVSQGMVAEINLGLLKMPLHRKLTSFSGTAQLPRHAAAHVAVPSQSGPASCAPPAISHLAPGANHSVGWYRQQSGVSSAPGRPIRRPTLCKHLSISGVQPPLPGKPPTRQDDTPLVSLLTQS